MPDFHSIFYEIKMIIVSRTGLGITKLTVNALRTSLTFCQVSRKDINKHSSSNVNVRLKLSGL